MSADETRDRMIAAMPAPLGELFYELWQEVAWLHLKWAAFLRLYGTSPDDLALLNETAPTFFGDLQGFLWESVFLHLCRLTDPAETKLRGGVVKPNLTLERLATAVPDVAVRAEAEQLAQEAAASTQFARYWRNRQFAHLELPAHLSGRPADPLPDAGRREVEGALAAIRAAMHAVESRYDNGQVIDAAEGHRTSFEEAKQLHGSADSLLFFLRAGRYAEQERLAKYRRVTLSQGE